MTKKSLIPFCIFFLCAGSAVRAQDEETVTETFSSCSLTVKAVVAPVDSHATTGNAVIHAFLCNTQGIPIADQEIQIKTNCGTILCTSPDSADNAEKKASTVPCNITGADGTVTLYLMDIPFNTPGRVTASCTYKSFKVKAFSTFSISHKTFKRKIRKKIS